MSAREAGRELDALIAERLFGWAWEPSRNHAERMLVPPDDRRGWAAVWDAAGRPDWLPEYSTDIAAAWLVVAKVMEVRYSVELFVSHETDGWRCEIDLGQHDAKADTAPLAICRVALLAVEAER